MAKHLHIALQHTSDKMLEVMNRRNRFKSDMKLLEEISSYGYAIGTDYIVGHPQEDDLLWSEAIDRVKDLPLTHIHAFTYSKRDGTASATMSGIVRGDIAKKRYRELIEIISKKYLELRTKHNSKLEVLLVNGRDGIYYGYDQYFNKIEVKSGNDLSGNWLLIENATVQGSKNVALFE
jgi:tRNA A37 methylthiotransferase MiaB